MLTLYTPMDMIMMKKMVTRVYNSAAHPGWIFKFQWKNGTMKTRDINPYNLLADKDTKTTKDVPLEAFEKVVQEIATEMNLVGPWKPGSMVVRCAPLIDWD